MITGAAKPVPGYRWSGEAKWLVDKVVEPGKKHRWNVFPGNPDIALTLTLTLPSRIDLVPCELDNHYKGVLSIIDFENRHLTGQ